MTKKTQLSKAIAIALSGAALSLGAATEASAASTTMYNMSTGGGTSTYSNALDQNSPINSINPLNAPEDGNGSTWGYWNTNRGSYGTDGWMNGGTFGAATQWVGINGSSTVSNTAAFGFTGTHLNWGAEFTGGGSNTATISTFDSFDRYGVYADIDVAKGAWSDNLVSGAGGWRHDLDLGFFKTDTAGTVNLSVTGIVQEGTQFGFTIFKGTGGTPTYGHHGTWNVGTNTSGLTSNSLPGGGTNYDPDGAGPLAALDAIVAYSVGGANSQNLNNISFNAEAGQIYSIWLGGYRNGGWGVTTDGYALTISQAAPVPLPGAVWLFGGALASLIGANRRKRVMPA